MSTPPVGDIVVTCGAGDPSSPAAAHAFIMVVAGIDTAFDYNDEGVIAAQLAATLVGFAVAASEHMVTEPAWSMRPSSRAEPSLMHATLLPIDVIPSGLMPASAQPIQLSVFAL